jgi:hypothetical protein
VRDPDAKVGPTNDRALRVLIGLCRHGPLFLWDLFAALAFADHRPHMAGPEAPPGCQSRCDCREHVARAAIVTEFISLITWGFGSVGRYIVSDASHYQRLYGQIAELLEAQGIVGPDNRPPAPFRASRPSCLSAGWPERPPRFSLTIRFTRATCGFAHPPGVARRSCPVRSQIRRPRPKRARTV